MSERRADPVESTEEGAQASADLDLEMALLAVLASRDMGEATEPVRLDTLSPIEKEVLLQLIRGKLGLTENSGPNDVSAADKAVGVAGPQKNDGIA